MNCMRQTSSLLFISSLTSCIFVIISIHLALFLHSNLTYCFYVQIPPPPRAMLAGA